jgi:hypothetical protein
LCIDAFVGYIDAAKNIELIQSFVQFVSETGRILDKKILVKRNGMPVKGFPIEDFFQLLLR